MDLRIAKVPELMPDGRFRLSADDVEAVRQQVLRQNVRDVLEDFEGCGDEELEKSLIEMLGDDDFFDRFIKGLGDDGSSWSMADLVLCWDEQEHDWSYAPAEQRAIRSILGDLGFSNVQ